MGLGGFLKGLGKIALPVVGTALGGPLGGALGGALGGVLGGGGASGALGGGLLGGGGAFAFDQFRQANNEANKDRTRARELANSAVDQINRGTGIMNQQWQLGSPMRDAFRFGAMNFSDPTNPFSRGPMFSRFAQMLQMENQVPAGRGTTTGSPQPPTSPPTGTRRAAPRQAGGGAPREYVGQRFPGTRMLEVDGRNGMEAF